MVFFLKSIWENFRLALGSEYKWLLIVFAIWLFRVDFVSDTGMGAAKFVQMGAIAVMAGMLWKKQPNILNHLFKEANSPVSSLTLFYLYAVISTLWALLPAFAFSLSFQNLLIIGLAYWVFSSVPDGRTLEKVAIYAILSITIVEFLGSRYYNPSLFAHYLPNGSTGAILLSYCFGEYIRENEDYDRKKMLRWTFVMAALFLVLSTSGGANAAAVVAVGIAMLFGGKKLYALFLLVIGAILFFNQELVDNLIMALMPGKNMEVIRIGNGRETIWENLLKYASQRPWLGWGFACVERVNQLNIIGGQSLSDAHSNYVGIYGSLGYVGCVLFGSHLFKTGFYLFKQRLNYGFLGLLCAFCCATVNGYSYGFLSGKTCSITISYIIIIVLSYYFSILPWVNDEDVEQQD